MNLAEFKEAVVYSTGGVGGVCRYCPINKGCPLGLRSHRCENASLRPQPVWEAVEVYGAGYNRAPKRKMPRDTRSQGAKLLAAVLRDNPGGRVGKGQELLDRVLS